MTAIVRSIRTYRRFFKSSLELWVTEELEIKLAEPRSYIQFDCIKVKGSADSIARLSDLLGLK